MIRVPAVWINGRPEASDGAHLSANDRGLTLADGVFETIRVANGRPFRLEQHLARLRSALVRLAIPVPADLDRWIAGALASASDVHDGDLRVTVTRGPAASGLAPAADALPTVIVALRPFPAFPDTIYERGVTSIVASGRKNERAMTAGLKTLAYTDSVAAMLEARAAGTDEALFLDTDGHCSEATASNLFIVKDGALHTPPLVCGPLPGITRAVVIELAATVNVDVLEEPFGVADAIAADEAFLTSSLRGIAPLVVIDGSPVSNGKPGRLTRALQEAYAALLARECGQPASAPPAQ
jgi:branched-chain amino acid aminotransferase